MKKENKMNNKGFSLVELIIVVAIMAILIGVLAPQYIKYVEKSRQSTDLQNIQALKTAIEAGAAGEDITADTTITVTGGTSGMQVTTSASGLAGVTTPIALKSTGWPSGNTVYTFSISSYTWATPATDPANNTKAPNYNTNSVFK